MMAAPDRHMALTELLVEDADLTGLTGAPVGTRDAADAAVMVSGVCLDTRSAAEGFLYLALAGGSTHGLHFVAQAIERKVVAIAAEPGDLAAFDAARLAMRDAGVLFVEVPRLKQRAGFIAARFFGQPSKALTVVAVTGTDGKTSVCHFVQSALAALGTRCGYIGTLGWGFIGALETTELTTPDAVTLQAMIARLRDGGADVIALEASSHGIAEGRLDAVDIDVAVLTNLGRDHLDYHVDLENYRQAKARLFGWPSLQAQVVNAADPFGRELSVDHAALATWGFASHSGRPSDSDMDSRMRPVQNRHLVTASDVRSNLSGLRFSVVEQGHEESVTSPLVGHFNVDNLLACFGVLRVLGHAANDACAALEKVTPVPGRMEMFAGEGQPSVIVDFAHTPDALVAAIRAARQHCEGELWVVFGCGGDRDPGKRAPMGAAAELADHIIITDDNPRTEDAASVREQILGGLSQPARALVIGDRTTAIRHAIAHGGATDIVLVAGKGHEDYQIIGIERREYSDRATVAHLLQAAVQ